MDDYRLYVEGRGAQECPVRIFQPGTGYVELGKLQPQVEDDFLSFEFMIDKAIIASLKSE